LGWVRSGRLDLGLLVEAEHHGAFGRAQIEPHNVDQLGLEVRVVWSRQMQATVSLPMPMPMRVALSRVVQCVESWYSQ
jgi:hypothetical protein